MPQRKRFDTPEEVITALALLLNHRKYPSLHGISVLGRGKKAQEAKSVEYSEWGMIRSFDQIARISCLSITPKPEYSILTERFGKNSGCPHLIVIEENIELDFRSHPNLDVFFSVLTVFADFIRHPLWPIWVTLLTLDRFWGNLTAPEWCLCDGLFD